MRGDYNAFAGRCLAVGEAVKATETPLVVHHFDADGLSSGGLVANALSRAGRAHAMHVLKKVDAKGITEVRAKLDAGGYGGVVFVDLGSGQNSLLEQEFCNKGTQCIVIDHHVPQKKVEAENYLQANCMDHGFDGSVDACSASTAFYCFDTPGNEDLVQLAIVGAVGDIQDSAGLIELNARLVERASSRGYIEVKNDLRLFGRVSRSLVGFLQYATEPFLPGLTGNPKACALFLDEHDIPLKNSSGEWLHYNDLDAEHSRMLASALINHLLSKNVPAEVVQELFGPVYEFPGEDVHSVLRDAHEYSTLLNACGRHENVALGIDVTMRAPGALEAAQEVLLQHRIRISEGINHARGHTSDVGPFYFLDARGKISDSIVGTVAGNYLNSGAVERTKPILALALDEQSQVKASARATKQLVARGVDLNAVMRQAAEACGGLGGGHKIAAGATFPQGRENEFLRKAGELLRLQTRQNHATGQNKA